jgi:hypothetical protein
MKLKQTDVKIGSEGYYNYFGDSDCPEELEKHKYTIIDETRVSWIATSADGHTVKIPKKTLRCWDSIQSIQIRIETEALKNELIELLKYRNDDFDIISLKFIKDILLNKIELKCPPPKEYKILSLLKSTFRDQMRDAFTQYIASDRWRNTKNEVKHRDGSRCKDCKRKIEEGVCHHQSYANWGKGNFEEIADCTWLCLKCHAKRHNNYVDEETPFWAKRFYKDYIIELDELKKIFMNEI